MDLDARVPLQDVEDDRDDLLHKKHLMLAITKFGELDDGAIGSCSSSEECSWELLLLSSLS